MNDELKNRNVENLVNIENRFETLNQENDTQEVKSITLVDHNAPIIQNSQEMTEDVDHILNIKIMCAHQ